MSEILGQGADAVLVSVPPKPKRTCNMHEDCDAADARAVARGSLYSYHCHDDECEDCFGT